uniref:uncharacterized protein LOC124050808 isoform X1 n=1 Tax=Scatophagus argus TaxID=75038 RepID=UPI001ED810FB|nr:uncharacterized protein LOC124050808 isoform X1 [Scatophagus argus]
MASVEEFLRAPSEELLESCSREQLVRIADYFSLDVGDKRMKDNIKSIIKANLVDRGMLGSKKQAVDLEVGQVDMSGCGEASLTFEQRRELLLLQTEMEKLALLRKEAEIKKMEMEERRLSFPAGTASPVLGLGRSTTSFDVVSNLRLLPQFNERDPDTFFSLFERVAESREWSDPECTLLLQCVLTGRAQEAYSALTVAESKAYSTVKAAVLKAYELVPEAYRRKFRAWEKSTSQSHMEFARDLVTFFNRWCNSLKIDSYVALCDLIVLEQFKNSVPSHIAVYISEHKVKTATEAAALADEYVLTHRGDRVSRISEGGGMRRNPGRWEERPPQRPGKFEHAPRGQMCFDSSKICNFCRGRGHWKADCPKVNAKRGVVGQANSAACAVSVEPVFASQANQMDVGEPSNLEKTDFSAFVSDGWVSLGKGNVRVPVKILRDTAACDSYILDSVLPFSDNSNTGDFVLMRGMGMNVVPVPLHSVVLNCGLVQGEVALGVRPALPIEGVDVILGNGLAGSRVWPDRPPPPIVSSTPTVSVDQDENAQCFPEVFAACAVTRTGSRAKEEFKLNDGEVSEADMVVVPDSLLSVSRSDLVVEQRADPSLRPLFELVLATEDVNSVAGGYLLQGELLVRKWLPHGEDFVGKPVFQTVVPAKFRDDILKTAHNQLGHLGVRKTYNYILHYFFWPRLKKDVSRYIRLCHTCQMTGKPNQNIKSAPLCPIPAIGQPFEHLIIDCVGPLPRSKAGSNYLLTVMCQSTRYPAAYPLRSITTKSIVKALTQFISIFGIPKVIQSDQGSNFSSKLFAQVLKQLKIQHNWASAYHPQSQGALERFHQTLKSLLRSFCVELNQDWEEGLPWLLLAAREVSQESTGFSPNELVFGHTVRGPLTLAHDGVALSEPPSNLIDYVNGFRHRLYSAGEMAKEKLLNAQTKMKRLYDRKTEQREFSPGDQVLALLPVVHSPFQARFTGPFTVLRQVSEQNYLLSTPKSRKSTRLCHVNLLKPYYFSENKSPSSIAAVRSQFPTDGDDGVLVPDETLLHGKLKNSETLGKLESLLSHLSGERCAELCALIHSYSCLFGDTPTQTHVIEHDIDVGDAQPIRQRFYRVSEEKHKLMETEIKYMLENGIAQHSSSSWASPCLLVEKSDKSPRFCTDFRKVNAVTKPDAYPLPRVEDCIDQVGSAQFVSKFDLLKGYWQVPLSERAKEISAFITPSGLFSYTVMSFGLRNAPATFQRLMNIVLSGLEGCAVYLDDVVIYSNTWEEHLARIKELFDRLREARLTVNLAKCEFAKATVTYLGKVVGQGKVCAVQAKVRAIEDFPVPTTKKELQRFLGLVGYYRNFCRNFSTVIAPLTDLLKGKVRFIWSESCQLAFDNVKAILCSPPVLAAPRMGLPFTLQVDASDVGAGAVLLQAGDDGMDRPAPELLRDLDMASCLTGEQLTSGMKYFRHS